MTGNDMEIREEAARIQIESLFDKKNGCPKNLEKARELVDLLIADPKGSMEFREAVLQMRLNDVFDNVCSRKAFGGSSSAELKNFIERFVEGFPILRSIQCFCLMHGIARYDKNVEAARERIRYYNIPR